MQPIDKESRCSAFCRDSCTSTDLPTDPSLNSILEGGAASECLRLIVGQLPQSKTGSAAQSAVGSTLPVSPYYAIALAKLAAEHGFDGYLLNFECSLQGGLEEARALAAWITLLQSELIERVGPHAEAVWYDSVTFGGILLWQNRLNAYNLPFFIPSTGFFSNYWVSFFSSSTKYIYSVFASGNQPIARTPLRISSLLIPMYSVSRQIRDPRLSKTFIWA